MDQQLIEDYRTLEVSPGITLEQLKAAYREILKVWHPDRFHSDPSLAAKAQEKTKRINLAYERLKIALANPQAQRPGSNYTDNAGLAEEYFLKGVGYFEGKMVPQNYEEAVRWFLKSSELGHPFGKEYLGWCLFNGWGVTTDYPRAFRLFNEAVKDGCRTACWKIATCYREGKGTRVDEAVALKWFYKSAMDGDYYGQYLLGMLLLNGDGVLQNRSEAQQWFGKSASAGYKPAEEQLTKMRNGSGASTNSPPPAAASSSTDETTCSESQDKGAALGCLLVILVIIGFMVSDIGLGWVQWYQFKLALLVCVGCGSLYTFFSGKK